MSADRNLLFGVLALQMDFIARDSLVEAMNAWVLDKKKPLGQILVERDALREDARQVLDALVEKHLELHGGDPKRSLASVQAIGSLREDIQQISDSELHESLAAVPPIPSEGDGRASTKDGSAADPFATRWTTVGTPTSSGLRFRKLRPHARGGLGEVFVARDEELGREVALKEIQDRYADDGSSRSRFVLEAEITGGLEHPGIVPVYGMGSYPDGRPYYAMRFIRGESLRDAIAHFHEAGKPTERALEFSQLLGRLVDMCNAVAYGHSRGVLHRDLKPANVMLGKYGETLVVDWGLAKTIGRADGVSGSEEGTLRPASGGDSYPTVPGSAMGTPHYMPPEQAAGKLDLMGPASDVYSLGATLYHLLIGKAPFEGREVGEILQRVQAGDFPPPRRVNVGVPAALEAVCLKAMAMRPEDRYASAKALSDEIEQWLADQPVAAYREPWTVRAGRWVRRHRTKVTGAVAAVAAAAACLAVATVLLAAANRREREAKDAVTRERDEVNTQKERADRNLASARKAVEDFCVNVAADSRLNQADLSGLRKKLLEGAVSYYDEFIQQKGDDADLQVDRGRAYWSLAFLRAELGQTDQAIADYTRTRTIFAELARLQPDFRGYQSELAKTHNNLGILLQSKGQFNEAEQAYRQALDIFQKLTADSPTDADDRGKLVPSDGKLVPTDSVKLITSDSLAYIVALPTPYSDHRIDLARCHCNLGNLLKARGQFKEAEQAYRQALDICRKLVGTGDHRNAVLEVDSLVSGKNVQCATFCDAARVFALASASIKNNAKLADQYAARAVELLRKARDAGYFKDPARVANMKKDSDLDSLRSRDDYKKLVADLEKK
jgi:serine/threonine-protein kinase